MVGCGRKNWRLSIRAETEEVRLCCVAHHEGGRLVGVTGSCGCADLDWRGPPSQERNLGMKGCIRKLQATGHRVPLLQLPAGLGFHVFDVSPAGRELRLTLNLRLRLDDV